MENKEIQIQRDKITELVWSKSRSYTVEEYKGDSDCSQYLTANEALEIIDQVKGEYIKEIDLLDEYIKLLESEVARAGGLSIVKPYLQANPEKVEAGVILRERIKIIRDKRNKKG